MQFWFAVIGAGALGLGVLISGRFVVFDYGAAIDFEGPWLRLVLLGLSSSLTFFLISEAFRRAPASTIAPFQYLEIVGATILGYLVFGDFPDVWVYTAVMMAALPTATNVFVIGQQYGVWVERASASILLTTLISVITLTALLYAITTGMLPPNLFR